MRDGHDGRQRLAGERDAEPATLRTYSAPTPPSGSFGGAVSQDVVEVLMAATPTVRVSQDVIEVLVVGDGAAGGTGSPVTRAFTFAG